METVISNGQAGIGSCDAIDDTVRYFLFHGATVYRSVTYVSGYNTVC